MQKSCDSLQICAVGLGYAKTKHTYVIMSHTLVYNHATKKLTISLWNEP